MMLYLNELQKTGEGGKKEKDKTAGTRLWATEVCSTSRGVCTRETALKC